MFIFWTREKKWKEYVKKSYDEIFSLETFVQKFLKI